MDVLGSLDSPHSSAVAVYKDPLSVSHCLTPKVSVYTLFPFLVATNRFLRRIHFPFLSIRNIEGIKFRHRYILTPYVVLMGVTLGLAVGGAMQASADYYNVYNYAKRQWWEMTYQQEQLFQHHFLCCNFDHVDPCCRWAVGEGACENEYMCFDRIRPHLMEQFKIISSTASIHAVICGIVFTMALGLVITLQVKRCMNGEYDGDLPLKQLAQSLTSRGKGKEAGAGKETELEDLGY